MSNSPCDHWIFVLIETLWNVNPISGETLARQMRVLIETLWNVNIAIPIGAIAAADVLIETLWNVNVFPASQP